MLPVPVPFGCVALDCCTFFPLSFLLTGLGLASLLAWLVPRSLVALAPSDALGPWRATVPGSAPLPSASLVVGSALATVGSDILVLFAAAFDCVGPFSCMPGCPRTGPPVAEAFVSPRLAAIRARTSARMASWRCLVARCLCRAILACACCAILQTKSRCTHSLHRCVPSLRLLDRPASHALNSLRGQCSRHALQVQWPHAFVAHVRQTRLSAWRAFQAARPNSVSDLASPHFLHVFLTSHVKQTR